MNTSKLKLLLSLQAFVLFCAPFATAQSVYPGQHKGKMCVEDSVVPQAEAFDLNQVRLLPGRVHDNLSRDSAWMASISVKRLTHSFKNNAGTFAGLEGGYESIPKYGGWESLDCDLRGHTTGHLLSAYGLMYAATGDELFKLKGDSIVGILEEVQNDLGPSGYLSAFPEKLIDRNIQGKSVWAPWYTLHKIMAGLIDQYLYADNAAALSIAQKMADWAYNKLMPQSEETRRLMLRNEFGGMNEAFLNLYSVTGNRNYKELAGYFYHNDVLDPLKEGNFDMGTKHTNTFIPKLIGEARNYELTGCRDSREMSDGFWNCMVDRHVFATGSLSQKEHFFDPDKFSQFINGYTGETCCTYNMLKLTKHLFCRKADPMTMEYYERALFNHILAQQDPQSGMVCYFLPLMTGAHKVYSTPEHSFWCCVGSGFESHAKYAESIYFRSDDELLVNLFIPSVLNWEEKGLKIRQLTEFPNDGRVTLLIEDASQEPFDISLRYPRWSGSPVVTVNGRPVKIKATPSSYITLRRKWKKGDKIEATFPISLHVEATPDNPGKGAVMYGPIVLGADLGSEGMVSPAPFSDPSVRNDYYTYDYHIPSGLPSSLDFSKKEIGSHLERLGKDLSFKAPGNLIFKPLYELNHCRYGIYWDFNGDK